MYWQKSWMIHGAERVMTRVAVGEHAHDWANTWTVIFSIVKTWSTIAVINCRGSPSQNKKKDIASSIRRMTTRTGKDRVLPFVNSKLKVKLSRRKNMRTFRCFSPVQFASVLTPKFVGVSWYGNVQMSCNSLSKYRATRFSLASVRTFGFTMSWFALRML